MSLRWILLGLCLAATACSRPPEVQTSGSAGQGAVAAPATQRKAQADIDWSQVRLEAGDAWVDCGANYIDGDGRPVLSLVYLDLREAMQDCRGTGLLRLRYKGKVTASFAALVERSGKVASDLGIGKRILDIDSAGGHVEAAIRAGDAIGENDWTIWVRDDSACHSACVLLLAAGDMRVVAGPVGIHRMMRVGSSANSRLELGEELRKVSDDLRNYLERNGASADVYDLMTTVPNHTLRVLTPDELERYGLSGANAVEDDLNRIRLARRCGSDFVRRRDAFRLAYDAQCTQPADEAAQDVADINACGMALRGTFGFPDAQCPHDSPMAELDGAILAMPADPAPVSASDADTAQAANPGQPAGEAALAEKAAEGGAAAAAPADMSPDDPKPDTTDVR